MPNILICDDEKDIVNALKIYLSDPDYTLYEAYNGMEALSILGDHDIHLILLDIMMPVMDGMTALRKCFLMVNRLKLLIYNEVLLCLSGFSFCAWSTLALSEYCCYFSYSFL